MVGHAFLNHLLEEVQQESANNGGEFGFLSYPKADEESAFDYLKAFLERIPVYQHPYTEDAQRNTRYYHSSRDIKSSTILPLDDWLKGCKGLYSLSFCS